MHENEANWTKEERALERALCSFCNGVSDPFPPASKWNKETERNFIALREAYNAWYSAKKP